MQIVSRVKMQLSSYKYFINVTEKNLVIKCVSMPLFVWETLPRVTTRMTSNDELFPRAPIGYDDWGRVSENRTRKRHNKNTNDLQ